MSLNRIVFSYPGQSPERKREKKYEYQELSVYHCDNGIPSFTLILSNL